MKRLAFFSFAFAWLAACDTASAPTSQVSSFDAPSFAKISNDKFPVSGTLFNSCPPQELVEFEGFFHFLVTGEETPTSSDIKIHVNLQGVSGVGLTSGDRYSIAQNEKTDIEFTPTTSEQETDFRFRLIRQGSDDNLWVRQTFRFTFPPGTFELIRNETECRG
jgi:hypothetical protein